MSRTDPQISLRVPPDVKKWLSQQASRNMRSLNAEVVMAIKEKMATTGLEFGDADPAEAGDHNTHKESCSAAST
ncbi:Arc-like DNA binding dprotein [Pseudaminobacter salicylatoxidans]|uniref:Arc-like DNA binding dprotein n=1 Tax=Pseudaminobacter salicylatoxidans TaxID=93369 RepID=A0A316BQP1_PSESE|nr:Arc family DNA-binding protein [Pseudaminobacter salicylatoxidans]PWJ75262.1 Arc-like DNA binding dprotein [Pseudaminobacter salicylatoxidans]